MKVWGTLMLMGKHLDILKKLLKVLPIAIANILHCMHTANQFIPATLTTIPLLTGHAEQHQELSKARIIRGL